MGKYPVVKQYDQKDCGPAALLSVLKFYKGDASLPYLRELCNTSLNGSTMLDLVNAANEIGFDAFGASGKYEDLMKEKMPCIAHVVIDEKLNHFVVVYKITPEKIFIADPGKGKYWLSKNDFLKIWKSNAVVLLKPKDELLKKETPRWYNWVFQYLKKEETWAYQSLFLGTVYTALGLVTAMFVQLLIDKYIPEKDFTKIIYSGIILLSILLIKSFAGYFRQRFLIILNKNVNVNINTDFLLHLFKLPKKFFDTRKIGDITARMNDAMRIQRAILQIIGVSIIDLFVIVASFGFMFYFSSLLAWLSLALIPIYALVLFLNVKKLKNQQNDVMKSYAMVESTYIDSLKGVDEIISYNSGNTYSKINQFFFGNYQEKIKTLGFTQNNLSLFAEIFSSLIIVGILTSGALWVIEGKFLIGQMMAAYSLLANILPAVNRFVNTTIVLQETSIATTRLMDMLLVEKENETGNEKFNLQKNIRLENAAFSWNGRNFLFENLNMKISRGKITALWGASGSGKTTIVQILQRKYLLNKGELYVDDLLGSNIQLEDYRNSIGVVPQTIKIFNGTIAENILIGRTFQENEKPIENSDSLEKTNFEVLSRLSYKINELGLTEFYQRFDYGLATLIGEEGRELSGGEKQLISITRALLNDPKVLIVDEGLSGIDIELEKMIFDVIKNYSKQNAVLLITHNLNSIIKTDYVYVLANGTISQEGTPQKLISTGGYFNKMWNLKESIYENMVVENE